MNFLLLPLILLDRQEDFGVENTQYFHTSIRKQRCWGTLDF